MVGETLFHNRAPSLEKEFCWMFSFEYFKYNLSELAERVMHEWTLRTFLNRVTTFFGAMCLDCALNMQFVEKTNCLKVKCEIVQK